MYGVLEMGMRLGTRWGRGLSAYGEGRTKGGIVNEIEKILGEKRRTWKRKLRVLMLF